MDVLNKLKNTVTNTVSQLSGVLPGNPVTREFEATKHIASYGPGLLWKVYAGYKKSTKQEAAIFVLEKKLLEKYSKHDRDVMLENFKKGVSQLTRLRHPKILTVQHPLEESRESLAFATEPVFASLANVLGQHENMPNPLPTELKEYKLYEVEIKYGILQLAESLAFLHNDVKLLHRNIAPESILINKAGSWKIAGFEFCIINTSSPSQQICWEFHEWDINIHHHAQPNLDYLAPEYALTLSCDIASDMFSLGVLIYTVFNKNKPLFENNGNFSTFKKNACELKSLPYSKLNDIPDELREYVKMLLNVTPEVRPDAHQFSKITFFDDIGAKTLQYLDSLFQWNNLQKSQFYKGLPQIITKMPKRVNLHRILPCLLKEFPNTEMIPFVLPNVLLIAEDATKNEFNELILPELKPVFQYREPVQILLIFLQKMEILLTKTPPKDVKNHILPMIYGALECNVQQIQELCLTIIPNFASLIEYSAMKNSLLPRIKNLCINTAYLSIRVNCLICIGKLLEHLDKWLVLDDILTLLPEIPSKEPAVLMGILGIYKLTMAHKKLGITKEIMATKVIPFLMPLCIENGLSLNQFNAFISLVKEMVNQVESEQRYKLEQLNSIQQEQKSALEMSAIQPIKKDELISGLTSQPLSEMDHMFEGLGLGSYLQEKDVAKLAAGLLSPANESPLNQINSHSKKSNLTLEEKQNLAKAQEQQLKLKQPPSMQNISTTPLPPEAKPIQTKGNLSAKQSPTDLTHSLMTANIMSLTTNKMQSEKNSADNFYGYPSGTIPSQGFSTMYSSVNSNFNPTASAPTPRTYFPMNAGSWGNSSQTGTVSNYSTVTQPITQKPNLDLSAFDSLLQIKSGNEQQKMSLHDLSQKKNLSSPSMKTDSIIYPLPSPQTKPVQCPSAQSDLSDLLG